MSNGDDQPQGGFERFPRSSAGGGGGYLFDEPRHRVPPIPPPPSASVFDDPTIQIDQAAGMGAVQRSRILENEPRIDESDPFPYGPAAVLAAVPPGPAGGRPYQGVWAGDNEPFGARSAPPFAPAGPHREAAVPPLERLMESAYRWRSLLGLALAGLMTVAIVVAYRGATGNEQNDAALAPADGQTGAGFGDTTAPSTLASTGSVPAVNQQVGSSVGEVSSTTLSPAAPTKTTGSVVTVRPTSTTLARSTSSSASASTTTPSSSTPSSSPPTSGTSSTTAGSSSTSTPASTTPTSSGSSSTSSPSSSTGSTTGTTLATKDFIEAEDGPIGGAQVAADHGGYTGTGFVSDIVAPGRGITVSTKAMAAGPATLRVRYAAGNTALSSPRRLTLRVNGVDVKNALTMPNTASWTDWKTVAVDIELKEGVNTITLVLANGDNGVVNVDSFDIS